MKLYNVLFGVILPFFLGTGSAENILAFLPIATKSHRNVFDPLIKALAERGHQLTVVSPFEVANPLPNVTEVVPVKYKDIWQEFQDPIAQRKNGKVFSIFTGLQFIFPASEKIIQSKELAEVLDRKFDLILYNGFNNYCFECKLYKMNVPVITITTMAAPQFITKFIGNRLPSSHVPLPFLNLPDRMTFLQRMFNFFIVHFIMIVSPLDLVPKIQNFNRKHYGDDCAPLDAFPKNISMILSNSFFALTFPRPALPDLVEVGGMHCRPARPLPEDLEDFVSGAEHGFIFFSMGSVVDTNNFPEEYRLKFIQIFGKLKQRVLWKWNSGHMEDLPANVRVGKWLPQQDLLGHPNIRVFITHGGLLSTQEAVYHGVPVLGIPVFVDQDLNVNQAENSGYALSLEILTFTEEELENRLNQLLYNPQYSQKAKELSQIFRDQPQTPLERAVFWVEYVLRHKGALQLRSPARNLNFFQYYCVDVVAVLLFGLVFIIATLLLTCKWLFRLFFRRTSKPADSKTKKE